MRKKFKIILLGLITTMILFVITNTTFCAESEKTHIWTQLKGFREKLTEGKDVKIDKDGNSYMVGYIVGNKVDTVFISKYTVNGNKLWTRRIENTQGTGNSVQSFALDSAGNCYVACTNDNNKIITSFIVKYTPEGKKEWLKAVEAPNVWTYIYDIEIDKSDNLYITGFIGSEINENIPAKADLFIANYNLAGIQKWIKLLGDTKTNTYGLGIAIDTNHNLYVAGETDNIFDMQNIRSRIDGFVVKCDSNGNKKWTRLLGTTGDNNTYAIACSVAIDNHGNCFISGDTNGQIDGKAKIGKTDSFIIAYTPDGNKLWSKLIGAKKASTWNNGGIVIDSLNNLYLSIDTDGALESTKLIGLQDTYVIKYPATTQEILIKQLGVANGTISSLKIAIDKNNRLYVVGSIDTTLEGEPKIGPKDAFITTYFNK